MILLSSVLIMGKAKMGCGREDRDEGEQVVLLHFLQIGVWSVNFSTPSWD